MTTKRLEGESLRWIRERKELGEDGAVLPIVAILIVVLLTFAAFTIDLGAMWGQRTLNQTAADGGVMAGAVSFIDNTPESNAGIVAEVERMVDENLGYSIAGQWASCVDPEVTSGNFKPLRDATDAVINPCVSLSVGASDHGEKTLRVYLPTQNIETTFAAVIGIDEISTGAFAEANLEFGPIGGALPFVIPASAGPGEEYCIGDMPPGIAQDECDGSNTGKRNDIISPWHGTDDPGTPACTNDAPATGQLRTNIALGLDHVVKAGAQTDPPMGDDDICEARDEPYVPYSLVLGGGGEEAELINGFAGTGPFGSSAGSEGRLRQGSGATRLVDGGNTDPSNMHLDNVGLWEYLENAGSGICGRNHVEYVGGVGVVPGGVNATATIRDCLKNGTPEFSDDILNSPRFALVPRLWLTAAQLDAVTPNSRTVIQDFLPVYVQSTYWNCIATPGSKDDGDQDLIPCPLVFQSYEDEELEGTGPSNDILNDQPFFAPGEGDAKSCLVSAAGGPTPKCKNNPNVSLRGVTVFVLDPDWVPEDAFSGGPQENQPTIVYLSR